VRPIEGERTTAATEGERKTVTALFADIKDSTELMADLDPEEARAIIDPALKLMIDAVKRYDGYVVQSTGDGIFALFGAPAAYEDHPQRALYAALQIQQQLGEYSGRRGTQGEAALQARVGVNTGEIVVRSVETGGKVEYTPIGHTANLASRLQTMAPAGSIVTSEYTRKLCEGYFELRELGRKTVKGLSVLINIYEVIGLGSLRSHFELSARRGLTRFVGREAELAQLNRDFAMARSGRGQIAAIVADAGTGKSRLVYEFKATIPDECKLLEAYSVSHGKASPWLPVLELLRGYFALLDADDEATRRQKIRAALTALDGSLTDALPYLWNLLSIPEEPDPLAQMDAQIKRQRTIEALKRIALRESLNQPVVIIFEDLHWIDSETQALLDLMAGSIANARVLMLVNYRPEYRHEWGNKSYYSQLRLDALDSGAAGEMLTALLGDNPELGSLKRLIIERTEGNPFFIEEMLQALFDEGVLARNGVVKIARPFSQVRLPLTVQGILAARIDRQPREHKELLQTLAVIGRESRLDLIRQIVPTAERRLHRILSELQASEFIYEQPAFPQAEYIFKHALTQEVAYNLMLVEQRKALHERAGQALESMFPHQLEDHLGELARHYSSSDNISKGVEYLGRAGQQAMQHSAHLEAINYLQLGLDFLMKLPETPERQLQELALQSALGPSLMETRGDSAPEVEAVYGRIAELGERTGQTQYVFGAQGGLFLSYMVRGQFDTAQGFADRLLDLAERSKDPAELLIAHAFVGINLYHKGDLTIAHDHFERAAAHFDPPRQRHLTELYGMDIPTGCSGYAACPLWMMGYPDQALVRIERGLSLARERDHLSSLVLGLYWASFGHLLRRESQRAQELAEAGLALSDEHGFGLWTALCSIVLGRALAQSGHHVKGITLMEKGISAARARGSGADLTLGTLAEAYGKMGQTREAMEFIEDALTTLAKTGQYSIEPELYRIRGELLLLRDAPSFAEAEHFFRTAIEKAQRHAAKSWELRAAISLARLLRDTNRRDEARTTLTNIYNWFTEGFDTADLKDAKALLDELGA
jgi:class 3 adenylate cyclase/predicted ATPase